MKSYKTRRKTKKVFNPLTIVTRIQKAIDCDLRGPTQEYGSMHSSVTMLRNRQSLEFTKKFAVDSKGEDDLSVVTFIKFLLVNDHMSTITKQTLCLPDDNLTKPQSCQSDRDNIFLRARSLMRMILTPFMDDEWFQYCKHGTGSSIDVSYKDTSLEAKSLFPITVTARAATIFDDYLSFDHVMNDAMLEFNMANPVSGRYKIVDGSRATTVPKSDKIRRMIAVEPTGNMYLQQGLMNMMYERMKVFRLDVETLPSMHRERARISSITSQEATIDWSSASDCVSTDLLRWLLPPKWFECLDRVRSPYITIGGEWVRLNMFSTMGNAGTFPLETLVFWCLGQALRLQKLNTLSSIPEWDELLTVSVFGDDCIVPVDIASEFIELCGSVGFIINKGKTFIGSDGFRESCGGDYLHGYDVRPYNIKAPTSNRQAHLEPWLYIIGNSLITKYITCFGSLTYMYDKAFFRVLFRLFKVNNIAIKLVPPYFPDDSGLKISFDVCRFRRHYPGISLSRIGRSDHGTYDFRFLRFQYFEREERVEYLHYATWLRQPGGRRSPWWEIKRRGSYVVAKGVSGCWSFPTQIY